MSDEEDELPTSVIIFPMLNSQLSFAIGLYSFCSSTLIVINKLAVHYIPSVCFVLLIQFVASVIAVKFLGRKWPQQIPVEPLEPTKIRAFGGVVAIFCLCLWTNMKALRYVNVEMVIVFRACSPIAVSLLDYQYLGRDLPSAKSALSMVGIALGSVVYFVFEKASETRGLFWAGFYFVTIVTEMAFVKHILETVQMTTWTRVYYNNALSIPFIIVLGIFSGDFFQLVETRLGLPGLFSLGLASAVGVLMSYAGFNLRDQVSATSFTVIGVLCKLATLLINHFLWEKHSNFGGYVGLVICILAGCFYEQAKKRPLENKEDLELDGINAKE